MAIVYISPTGNDSTGDGSSGNPWATISKAFSSTVSGDTIHCLAGTYTWVAQSFTSTRSIVGDSSTTTIFDAGGLSVQWSYSVNLILQNLTFQNNIFTTDFSGVFKQAVAGNTYVFTATNVYFNAIQFNPANAAALFGDPGNASNVTINLTACLFRNIENIAGAAVACAYILRQDNPITTSINVTNCTFYSNVVAANTCRFLDDVGGGTNAAVLTNNIVWNANGTNHSFDRGTYSYSGSNNDILGYSSAPSLSSQLSTDPLFVDATNANFNLRPSSPCIGAGTVI